MGIQYDRHDRLAVRLSVIISRLLAGESLTLANLAEEFGVSIRTLQRDFQQRLIHLDIEYSQGRYRLNQHKDRDPIPNSFTFVRNTGLVGILPEKSRQLIRWLSAPSSSSPCLISHASISLASTQSTCFLQLVEAIQANRIVSLLINGSIIEGTSPHRLIFHDKHWFLVSSRAKRLQVFRIEEIDSVTLLNTTFRRKPELDALTANQHFIAALPHFRFISDIIHTLKE